MQLAKVSTCGRFVVLEGLYLDRIVFEELDQWAGEHGLRAQDAIQLALCAFNQGARTAATATMPAADRHSLGVPADR